MVSFKREVTLRRSSYYYLVMVPRTCKRVFLISLHFCGNLGESYIYQWTKKYGLKVNELQQKVHVI